MPVLSSENKTVSLATRKEIKDYEGKIAPQIAKIEAATGVSGWTYDFEGDLNAFNEAVEPDRKNRLGEIIINVYLPAVTSLIVQQTKDSMIKEAFVEAITKKAIRFVPLAEKPAMSKYQQCFVKDGTFYVASHPTTIWSNMSQIDAIKLETIL